MRPVTQRDFAWLLIAMFLLACWGLDRWMLAVQFERRYNDIMQWAESVAR